MYMYTSQNVFLFVLCSDPLQWQVQIHVGSAEVIYTNRNEKNAGNTKVGVYIT